MLLSSSQQWWLLSSDQAEDLFFSTTSINSSRVSRHGLHTTYIGWTYWIYWIYRIYPKNGVLIISSSRVSLHGLHTISHLFIPLRYIKYIVIHTMLDTHPCPLSIQSLTEQNLKQHLVTSLFQTCKYISYISHPSDKPLFSTLANWVKAKVYRESIHWVSCCALSRVRHLIIIMIMIIVVMIMIILIIAMMMMILIILIMIMMRMMLLLTFGLTTNRKSVMGAR